MKAVVKVPGSCGELWQGVLDGTHLLITCPVNVYSYVEVNVDESNSRIEAPDDKYKSCEAMRKILDYFGMLKCGGEICIDSEIPQEKGMSSSTADIVGTCTGTAKALGRDITPLEIVRIAVSIEPTDGLMFKDMLTFDHISGAIKEYIGPPPEMDILVIDLGGRVNTLEFNSRRNEILKKFNNALELREAYELVKDGIRKKDIHMLGKGATMSAEFNQKILYKRELTDLMKIANELGACGVNTAHSGTVVGILFSPGQIDMQTVVCRIEKRFKAKFTFYITKLLNGGGELVETSARRQLIPN
ncbi:MAG: GHMP kinase [bacterium]